MLESHKIVSGKLGRKTCLFTTHHYNALSGKFGRKFVSTLSLEIDGIQAGKCKAKGVIFFTLVILKHVQSVIYAKNICLWIKFQVDCWNCGAFDKLVNDTHTAPTEYLVKYRVIQGKDQRHRTFSNLMLKENCVSQSYLFVQRNQFFFSPDKLALDEMGTIKKTVTSVLEVKHPHKTNPSYYTLDTYDTTLIFIPLDIIEDVVKSVTAKFLGSSSPGGMD